MEKTEEKKFDNVSFFRSKKNGAYISQISVLGKDQIILVPNYLKKSLPLNLPLSVVCTELNTKTGYVLVRYEPYIPKIDILLSRDKRNLTVLNAGTVTPYSYSISGNMTPKQFYVYKEYKFRNEYENDNLTRRWKAALQDISLAFNESWEDEEFETYSMIEDIELAKDIADDEFIFELIQ